MKVLLLCGPSLGTWERRVLETLFARSGHEIVGCLIDARPGKSFAEKIKANLRKGRGGYVLVMAWQSKLGPRDPSEETEAFMAARGVPVLTSAKPYGTEAMAWMKDAGADVMALIGGFGIVKKRMLEATPGGVLSYHHGDMRRYRGMPAGMWELYRGEREMGMTVQTLASGLDCGTPIVERALQIRPDDTVASLRERPRDNPFRSEAVDRLADPAFVPATIERYGDVYTLPNLRQWLRLQAKIAWRRLRHRVAGGTG